LTLRKKIFGSLFILGCAGIIAAAVFLLVGTKGTDPTDMVIPQPPPLPQINLSLSEMDRDILPDIKLPESGQASWGGINIAEPDVSISAPGMVDFTPEPMPSFSFDFTELQQLMDSIVAQ
jgi:hypothetical protein